MELYPNDTDLHRTTKHEITLKSRDNARTPMQWSNSPHAGFSTAIPWQEENQSFTSINAETQVGVKDSVFEYWTSILALRKTHKDVFIYGDFKLVDAGNDDVFAYSRTFGGQKAVIVCNFRKENVVWELPKSIKLLEENVLVSNYERVDVKAGVVLLRPFEAFATFVH
jgi:glycosidase